MNAVTQAVAAALELVSPRPALRSIEQHRADVAQAEAAEAAAKAADVKEADRHSAQAYELMNRDDDGAALARSHAAVDSAHRLAADAEAAAQGARSRLQAAIDAARDEASSDSWEMAVAMGKRKVAAFERSQKLLDQWLATLPGLLEAVEDEYQALPVKPDFRPLKCTKNGLAGSIELYVFGHSDGLICQLGVSTHVAKQRPSLVDQARDMSVRLLAADPRRKVAP